MHGSILQELDKFLTLVPLDDTDKVTFALNNYGVSTVNINTTQQGVDYDSKQTFSADLGPVEIAVQSNDKISPEQLIVSPEVVSNATGSLALEGLDVCPQKRDSLRIIYSAFRTDALFLTPETSCTEYAVGSIIVGVRIVGASNCEEILSVIVDLQELKEVSLR